MPRSPERSIAQLAVEKPDRLAIAEGDRRITYRELDREVDRFADDLRARGVSEGNVVTIWTPAWWEASALFNASLRLGAVPHSLAHSVGHDEATQIFAMTRPAAVYVGADRGDEAEQMADLACDVTAGVPIGVVHRGGAVESHNPPVRYQRQKEARVIRNGAALIFTSGSSGSPKGVVHGYHSLDATCAGVAERFHFTEETVIGMASPIGHVRWVMYGGMLPFLIGGTLLTASKWSPAEWATTAADVRCTFGAFSPKHVNDLIGLLEQGLTVPSLQTMSCGGSYLPTDVLQHAEQMLGGRIVRSYGCTEFPSASASAPDETEFERWNFDGKALSGVDIQLAIADDSGETVSLSGVAATRRIRLRGSHAAVGTLVGGSDELRKITDPQGWLNTTDFGEMTDGFLKVVGREADMIIRNGENINAAELEAILGEHPAIFDIAVAGRQDPVVGETVCAICVTKGSQPIDVKDLATFLGSRNISKWRWPESVIVVDMLPRTSSGKVRRKELWKMVNSGPTIPSDTGRSSLRGRGEIS